jgi:tetratricopeptide (TPR) repeat protein
MKAMGASLLGAGGIGLAVSAISTGLILFGDKLFGTSKRVKESDEALKAFNKTLEESKNRVDKLGESIQFFNSLSTLNIQIAGLPEVLDLQGQYIALQGELVKAVEETEIASRNAIKARIEHEKEGNEETKKTFDEAESIFKNAFKKKTDLEQKATLTSRQIALQRVKDTKDANEKEKKLRDEQQAEYEKWVSETISKGKELARYFEGRRVVPDFTIFDTRNDELRKALQVIREFEQGGAEAIFRVQTTIEPIFPPSVEVDFIEQVRERAKVIADTIKEGTGLQNLKLEIPTFITSKKAQNEQTALKDITQRIQEATFAANAMGSAFTSAFDSLTRGENALQAIGNALKQLVADLIKATIQALIFRAVTNLLVPGAGAASGAAAGAAGIGRLFGGGVAGLSGNSGFSGGITVAVQGELVGRGGSLVGVITRAGATNGRSFVG